MKLYIDDIRNPKDDSFVARSSAEAIEFLQKFGCPGFISFDHDLGGDDTAMAVVNWMIEKDLDSSGDWFNKDFTFNVHSANPVGAANIEGKLDSYLGVKNG